LCQEGWLLTCCTNKIEACHVEYKMEKSPKTLKQRLIARLEWFPIELGLFILPRLSRPMLLRLVRVMAVVGLCLDIKGRRFAVENIRFVFPKLSKRRRYAILVGCYRNFTRVLFDMFWFGGRQDAERIRQWAPLTSSWRTFLELPGPKVIVTAHHGNWEIGGQMVVANGFPLMSVGSPLGTPETTRKLNAFRAGLGQEIVSSDGAVAHLFRALRKGKNVALLADQHLWHKKGGVWTQFLGHSAQLAPTPAYFARRVPGLLIGVAFLRARADGSYWCSPPTVIEPGTEASIEGLTQQIADASAKLIRRYPTQWLFAYSLWRDLPKGCDGVGWPSYARPQRNP